MFPWCIDTFLCPAVTTAGLLSEVYDQIDVNGDGKFAFRNFRVLFT